MRTALLVARNELRRRLRDRSALVLAVVAPLVLASILGTAFSGFAGEDISLAVAVVDLDSSQTSRSLVSQVFESPDLKDIVTVNVAESEAEAGALIDDERVAGAVVIPNGLEASLAGPGAAPAVELLTSSEEPIAAELLRSVVDGWLARVRAGRLAAATAIALSPEAIADPAQLAAVASRAASSEPALALRNGGIEQEINLAAYFGPSMGILFLFLALGLMARSLLAERRDGTLARLQAAPIRLSSVMAGKALAVAGVGTASLLLLWGVTSVVFGASWGQPLPVAVLILVTVFAVGGIAALIASLAKTEVQAEGMTSMVAFVLGLLGGNFFPINQLPDGFLRVSRLTPNGVALQAFADLSFQRDDLGDILTPIGILFAVGLVAAVIATRRFQRVLT